MCNCNCKECACKSKALRLDGETVVYGDMVIPLDLGYDGVLMSLYMNMDKPYDEIDRELHNLYKEADLPLGWE